MGFVRRKSMAAADVGEEARPRNRLTKPMTKKSPTSQRTTIIQQPLESTSPYVSMDLSPQSSGQSTTTISERASRISMRSHLFEAGNEDMPKVTATNGAKKMGVASLVKQFESAASTSQISLMSPMLPQRPVSAIYSLQRSPGVSQQSRLGSVHSKELLTQHKASTSTLGTAAASFEQLVDPFNIPRRRSSNYRPGEATRKPSIENEAKQPMPEMQKPLPDTNKPLPLPEQRLENEDVQEQWTPPPTLNRTDTPTSLDCKAIGGLRLGSLHVVNGRSSPVLSELSRHLISRQLRDVSSEYADSTYSKDPNQETWEDDEVFEDADEVEFGEPLTPTRTTVAGDERNLATPTGNRRYTNQSVSSLPRTPLRSPDKTSMMAEEYQSELRNSPFSFDSSSLGSTGSVVHYNEDEGNIASAENTDGKSQFGNIAKPQSNRRKTSQESQSHSIESKPSEAESFSTRDQRFTSALEFQAPEFQAPPSPERGLSPELIDPNHSRGRPDQSPMTTQRDVSPVSLHSNDTITRHQQFWPSERGISPVSARPESASAYSGKVDSGYHSGTSTLSLNMKEAKTVDKQTLKVDRPQVLGDQGHQAPNPKAVSPQKEASPRKLGRFFPIRPPMRKSPATAPDVPTVSSLESEPNKASPASFPAKTKAGLSPKKMKREQEKEREREKAREREQEKARQKEREREEKLIKSQKKLHKDRPRSRIRGQSRGRTPAEIVVQRLASCESTVDIPAVSDTAKANLALRSEQVPELARTFSSQDHVSDQHSSCTVQLSATDIRFPSPLPDSDDDARQSRMSKRERDRSRGRSRSKSRRRSFLDMFRSDKSTGKQEGEASQRDTEQSIADFDDVFASLGANPYDIAHSRSHSQHSSVHQESVPNASPHVMSNTRQSRKRLSMSDEEASKFARRRSTSFNGLDSNGEPNLPPDRRVGLPGKVLRASVAEDEVPPVPTLPDKDELRRMSQRFSLQSQMVNTPTRVRQSWEESSSPNYQGESSPAGPPPPPPAHSPRPSFHSHQDDDEYFVESPSASAPPPPSHSPAPMNISASSHLSHSPQSPSTTPDNNSGSPWDAQARAWKARRQSIGEALKSQRQSMDIGYHDEYNAQGAAVEDYGESIYPAIPLRHPGRRDMQYRESREWMGNYNPHDYVNHDPYYQQSQSWNGPPYDPDFHTNDAYQFSESSYRSRQHRDYAVEDRHDHHGDGTSSAQFYRQDARGSRQSNLRSQPSNDSRQSFYSHHNCPIDRPFDPPPRFSGEFDDEHGYYDYHHTQGSPIYDRGTYNTEYDRVMYDGYESQHQPQYDDGYRAHHYDHDQYNGNYTPSSPSQPMSHPYFYQHPSAPPSHSPNTSHAHKRGNSLLPPSPATSRPTSRQSKHSTRSFHSNNSAISLAEELNPEIKTRPSLAPDFGRYSGGLAYGYEGRDAGFGGSAGTRSVSGKADGVFKGMPLRENFGVDLGDVPVIGVVKKVK